MTTCLFPPRRDPASPAPRCRVALGVALAVAPTLLAGCGDKKKDKPATQTAAKVNKEEITVHQINFVLAQQRGLPPEQAASAGRQVLERLIDQELALQKAAEQKLDRDPRVVQQIEAARREIIARAYLEKIGEGAPKPTPAEVKAYYEAHPALFKERRVYSLQEVAIEAKPEQVEALKKTLASAEDLRRVRRLPEGQQHPLRRQRGGARRRAAAARQRRPVRQDEGRPGDLQRRARTAPRSSTSPPRAAQPVDLEQATPAIEQFLLNERKRKLVADDLQALRGAAKIEYVGDFAADAAQRAVQAGARRPSCRR